MAERQSTHRQELEKRVIDSNCQAQKRGPILGFIIAMTTVVGGIFLIYKGKGAAGLTSVITALVGLVAVFFYGKKRQQKELAERAQAIIEHP